MNTAVSVEKDICINEVEVQGEVLSEISLCHEISNNKIYRFAIASRRDAQVVDIIFVQISERVLESNKDILTVDAFIKVKGEYRSCRVYDPNGKSHLNLYIYGKKFEKVEKEDAGDDNVIFLEGYICKKISYKCISDDRVMANILLATNGEWKSSYIPLIVWNIPVKEISKLGIGSKISIMGRLQSREYRKSNDVHINLAQEVFVYRYYLMENVKNRDD